MADKKVTQLTSSTDAPVDADLLMTVEDVSTVPVSVKKAWSVFKAGLKTYFDGIYPPGTFTAAGDILQASGAGAGSVLAIGTAHKSLFVNSAGSALEYAYAPRVLKVDTSTDFSNTAAEQTLFTYTVPANMLSTNRSIQFRGYYYMQNTSGGDIDYVFKWYFGTATPATWTISSGDGRVIGIDVVVANHGATNLQYIFSSSVSGTAGAGTNNVTAGSEDTTGAIVAKLTCAMASAASTKNIKTIMAKLELLVP